MRELINNMEFNQSSPSDMVTLYIGVNGEWEEEVTFWSEENDPNTYSTKSIRQIKSWLENDYDNFDKAYMKQLKDAWNQTINMVEHY